MESVSGTLAVGGAKEGACSEALRALAQKLPDKSMLHGSKSGEPMLGLIYSSIKQLQEETCMENSRARIATKQLQVAVRKVNRICSEIGERISAIEDRTAAMEANGGSRNPTDGCHMEV
ncbi:hypothetical protein NDU88_004526 [Pleurodeles waltl]|uniref:Uncharacterized protein n=1 Tax=Pleurodeles waltl TaxID=8319 RepID=A0AAV7QDA1_PLEWA|nr:hypothetical protein NDU88_004526 [Pleurodeles waltl]